MKHSCMAMVALLALAAQGPAPERAAPARGGDVHDRRDIGQAMRRLPGAAATADYVLPRERTAAPRRADAAPTRAGGGVRYVF